MGPALRPSTLTGKRPFFSPSSITVDFVSPPGIARVFPRNVTVWRPVSWLATTSSIRRKAGTDTVGGRSRPPLSRKVAGTRMPSSSPVSDSRAPCSVVDAVGVVGRVPVGAEVVVSVGAGGVLDDEDEDEDDDEAGVGEDASRAPSSPPPQPATTIV